MHPRDAIQELLDLQARYAQTRRAMITGERLGRALHVKENIDVTKEHLREPLIEHVGHLPIIASFLHPHITKSSEVNLGRVLTMLSVHDIGETVLGDVFSFKKNDDHVAEEFKVARKLLPDTLFPYFEEFEAVETFDAKYARSVDVMAPLLHEVEMPELTKKRFHTDGFSSKKIEEKKAHLFEWDPFLKEVFGIIIETYRKMERDEPVDFRARTDIHKDTPVT